MPKKEIIQLILRQLNQEESSKEERECFSNWLIEHPENLDHYIELKKLWETPFNKDLRFEEDKALQRITEATQKKTRERKRLPGVWQIAAGLLLLVSVGTYWFWQGRPGEGIAVYEQNVATITKQSGPGEQMRVTLPDESVIWLNAESSIRFPEKFRGDRREVTLSGEAFFQVTRNPKRPFIVHTHKITTTVLGTSFNIKAFDHMHTTVTVATGKVRVQQQNNSEKHEIYLLPNEQAVWDDQSRNFSKNTVDALNYYAWKDGTICFNNESLPESIQMLERWYNVTIKLNVDQAKRPHFINGNYKDKKLYNILDGLCYIYDLEYEYLNDSTIVITKKLNPNNS